MQGNATNREGKTRAMAAAAAVLCMATGVGCDSTSSPSGVQPAAIYATGRDGSVLVRIDASTGAATVVGPLGVEGAFALAQDVHGALFTVTDSGFVANPNARAASVDPRTGRAAIFGDRFGEYLRMMGLAFGRDGTLYGSSPITQSLYRIDLPTGRPTRIGAFGVNGIMDLAVDGAGGLWANTQTAIYRVNPTTGEATLAARVTGAAMLMGITFDTQDRLYATSYEADSMLYRIDVASGAATMVGNTGIGFVHSAEFVRGD